MRSVLVSLLAIALAEVAIVTNPPSLLPLRAPAATQSREQPAYDVEAEHGLLDRANQARAGSQLRPLTMEDCLTLAARRHAATMAAHQQLAHQFPGELPLSERLASTCTLHQDEVAENVAYANSAASAHESLMRSRAHRENLLHPSYNVAGIGVVRRGSMLYVVQDFGHSLPAYSTQQAGELIAKSIDRARDGANLPRLQQKDGSAAQSEACALAQADSLRSPTTAQPGQARYILRFTTMEPQNLPATGIKVLADRSLHAYAVGACFVRNATYLSGTYWVVLEIY